MEKENLIDAEKLIQNYKITNIKAFTAYLKEVYFDLVKRSSDPSKGIDKMIDFYLKKGYTLEWIEARVKAIIDRKKLTKVWQESGVKTNEYGILTNEIYKTWSGLTAK